MNYALPFCRGDIVGIYDAEDRPDPGQIRAVVQHLQAAPPEVACVQGYLDFYNSADNWLARCFTLEYAIWFRVVLLGVQRLGLPIPLGGTSVFFRRGVLEQIGAWDAHNVTEDADLGMRLARFGYRCEMIASTTWEEANCRVRPVDPAALALAQGLCADLGHATCAGRASSGATSDPAASSASRCCSSAPSPRTWRCRCSGRSPPGRSASASRSGRAFRHG